MKTRTVIITPPLCQLNAPYPASAFLAGYLQSIGRSCVQADLGLALVHDLFSAQGLEQAFVRARQRKLDHPVLDRAAEYLASVDGVSSFLAGRDPALAWRIGSRRWLPEGPRFEGLQGADAAFGSQGIQDRATWYASLYLADLADFIRDCVDPWFGFSRYGERLARSARTFDDVHAALGEDPGFCDQLYLVRLDSILEDAFGADRDRATGLVAITVPFPGNLLASLRMGQHLRRYWPGLSLVMGGGFVSTELRSLQDPRVFGYCDYLILDDGYRPLAAILEHLDQHGPHRQDALAALAAARLKRTMVLQDGKVQRIDNDPVADPAHGSTGTPDPGENASQPYLNLIDLANPMQRLWAQGQWNKIQFARGCYWRRCAFCDTSLPYIADYAPAPARVIADQMDAMAQRTGRRGFHGVDEAAPPALLARVAVELLRRGRAYSWWTNVRFDRCFDADLCRLLAAAGMIAASGGIEVASPRILARINKGVALDELARTLANFSAAGILTHGYLMYGFPGQTVQETIDSLEVVRQLFARGILVSGYWHRLSVTAHSSLGRSSERFGIVLDDLGPFPFATNDLDFHEPGGIDHDSLGPGLHKALYNYQHGIGLDRPVQTWFDSRVPRSSLAPDAVDAWLAAVPPARQARHLFWLGSLPRLASGNKGRRRLVFADGNEIQCSEAEAAFALDLCSAAREGPVAKAGLDAACQGACGMPLQVWLHNPRGQKLKKRGLLELPWNAN